MIPPRSWTDRRASPGGRARRARRAGGPACRPRGRRGRPRRSPGRRPRRARRSRVRSSTPSTSAPSAAKWARPCSIQRRKVSSPSGHDAVGTIATRGPRPPRGGKQVAVDVVHGGGELAGADEDDGAGHGRSLVSRCPQAPPDTGKGWSPGAHDRYPRAQPGRRPVHRPPGRASRGPSAAAQREDTMESTGSTGTPPPDEAPVPEAPPAPAEAPAPPPAAAQAAPPPAAAAAGAPAAASSSPAG